MKQLFACLAAALILTGCATKPEITEANNRPGQVWTVSQAAEGLTGDDPIEPFNRCMFVVTDSLMLYIIRPVSWIYGTILPKEVTHRIENVSDNLSFPGRMVSCTLQLKFKGSATELSRFLINSTLGIAGIFDPAAYYFHLDRRHEDMGHAFASWGIGPGCVFIFPAMTSVNPRDFIGKIFDYALDLKFIIPYAGLIANTNYAVNSLDSYSSLIEGDADRYETFRLGLAVMRHAHLNDYADDFLIPIPYRYEVLPVSGIRGRTIRIASYYHPTDPMRDTLRNMLFRMKHDQDSIWLKTSPWNTDFSTKGKIRCTEATATAPERSYQFWNLPAKKGGPAKKNTLVMILPGVGTRFSGETPRAFAELLTEQGYDVVTTSSVMHWEFAASKECAFPGYSPDDARHLRDHLQAVLADLKKRFDYVPGRVVLAGYSLGGLHALHIAALEEKDPKLNADRYIAVNPPADPLEAMRKMYGFMDEIKSWNRSQYYRYLGDIFQKYAPMANKADPFTMTTARKFHHDDPDEESLFALAAVTRPISREQAAGVISTNFRLIMRQLMISAHRNGFASSKTNPYSWSRRNGLYREIDNLSPDDYVKQYILPRHKGVPLEQLERESGVRGIESTLRNNPKLRVLHNLDDPLLNEEDFRYLDEVLGSRICWFDRGAHLGNMYLPAFQKEFLSAVEEK